MRKENWLKELLDRSDVSYTTPGRKDHIYVGKVNGVKKYEQKRYLLWNLRDLHDIANGDTETVKESFVSCFNRKLKPHHVFLQDISQ